MTEPAEEPPPTEHPVQAACRLTGLSPDVLRAWERRYQVVQPRRSPGGQRVYDDDDIARLRRLAQLVARGHRIGTLARLPDERLAALLAERAEELPPPVVDPVSRQLLDECLQATARLDAPGVDGALHRASVHLGLARFLEEVAAPYLREVGRLWEAGSLTPSHEHFGTTRMRTHLLGLVTAHGRADAPRLLASTPQGERHDLGALMCAVTAAGEGWDVTFLGGDLPAADMAAAALQVGARVIVLSAVHPDADADVRGELRALAEALPPSVRVIIGGDWCLLELRHLERMGITHAESLADLRELLRELRAVERAS
jgi:DNA-binding transcriptional MerR regulator/methylmalonyl-CoA mutase cobalamin-binding subunit